MFSSLMYLAKQNIAILGSKENGGNCIELLEQSNEIPKLKSILFKYAYPSIRKRHMQEGKVTEYGESPNMDTLGISETINTTK